MGEEKEKAPPREGGEASSNGQAANLNQENNTIPEDTFKGPLSLEGLGKLIDEFNLRYAVVNEAGKCLIFRKLYDAQLGRQSLQRISFADFNKMYGNRRVEVKIGDGGRTKNAAQWWIDSPRRLQYLGGVVFDPSRTVTGDYWNLWQGFSIPPKPGDWSLTRDHILKVICGGDANCCEYLLNWLARMFQRPGLAGEVAIVLRGPKGAGKGTLGNWVLKAWGQHGLHIANAKHLIGSFNGHLRDAVFLFADEAFAVTDRQQEAVLKALITEPTLLLEAKYQNPISVPNMTHILMASNDDWVVPASTDERRYFVLDVLPIHLEDRSYFGAINQEMEKGGLAGMIFDLLRRDIANFDHRAVPRTAALDAQKRHSLTSLQQWWHTVLDRGYVWKSRFGFDYFTQWHTFVPTELLFESYRQWAQETRAKKMSSREQLGIFFTSLYPQTRPSGRCVIREVEINDGDGDELIQQERPPGYLLGDLAQARVTFSIKMKLSFGWEDRQG